MDIICWRFATIMCIWVSWYFGSDSLQYLFIIHYFQDFFSKIYLGLAFYFLIQFISDY